MKAAGDPLTLSQPRTPALERRVTFQRGRSTASSGMRGLRVCARLILPCCSALNLQAGLVTLKYKRDKVGCDHAVSWCMQLVGGTVCRGRAHGVTIAGADARADARADVSLQVSGSLALTDASLKDVKSLRDVIATVDYAAPKSVTLNGKYELGIKKYTAGATWNGTVANKATTLKVRGGERAGQDRPLLGVSLVMHRASGADWHGAVALVPVRLPAPTAPGLAETASCLSGCQRQLNPALLTPAFASHLLNMITCCALLPFVCVERSCGTPTRTTWLAVR